MEYLILFNVEWFISSIMTINSNSTQMVDGWPTFFRFFFRNRDYLTIFHGLPFGICNIAMENG